MSALIAAVAALILSSLLAPLAAPGADLHAVTAATTQAAAKAAANAAALRAHPVHAMRPDAGEPPPVVRVETDADPAGAGPATASPAAASATAPPTSLPVLVLHGAVLGAGCVGADPNGTSQALAAVLRRNGFTGKVLPVDYYCGDSGPGAIDIRAGSRPTANTDIGAIAKLLANYIWRNYSSHGASVDLVGHSMGGLIMRYALAHAGHAGFPRYLLVRNAVTISAPFEGIPARASCLLQCRQMTYGSAFLAALNATGAAPSGRGGTLWTVLGGSPCDYIPASSTLSLRGADAINFASTSPVCYSHMAYLSDASWHRDVRVMVRGLSGAKQLTVSSHSLEWVRRALSR